jgi:FKBP-type peptidyl-prolyl cis-trans isomerase
MTGTETIPNPPIPMKKIIAASLFALAIPACQDAEPTRPETGGQQVSPKTTDPTTSMLETPKDVAAAPADAETTTSGLASKLLAKGTGETKPKATDLVTVHYSGWTTDGKLFDSSVKRGEPTSFPLNGVIAGWTEGLQLMVVGEKRRFWIPAKMAYGENPPAGYPAGTLVFDVELIKIGR